MVLAVIRRHWIELQVTALAVAHLVDVLVHRRSRVDLVVDAVEARAQHDELEDVGNDQDVDHLLSEQSQAALASAAPSATTGATMARGGMPMIRSATSSRSEAMRP